MIGWRRGGGGAWRVWVSSPCWTFSHVSRLAGLQGTGTRLGGNLDLVLRAVGVTGSDLGADRKRGLEGKRRVGPGEGGGSQLKGAGGKAAKAAWERRVSGGGAAALQFGKQRVTTTKRGDPRDWECGSPGLPLGSLE